MVSRYRGTVARPPDLRRKDAPEIPATFRPTMLEEPDREEQMWAEVLLNTPYQALFSTQPKSPVSWRILQKSTNGTLSLFGQSA